MITGAAGIAMSFFAMFSLYFVNAQFLQYVKGYSPLITGLAILPGTTTIFVFSRLSPRLVKRFGVKTSLVSGMGFMVIGLLLISFCGKDTPYILYAGALVVTAIGPGISNPSLSDAIMSAFATEKQASALPLTTLRARWAARWA